MTGAVQPDITPRTWKASSVHVRRALKWIRHKGQVTPDELVAWDAGHGRHLFDWDDPAAADAWRHHQARLFMNSFRGSFDKMRVRGFIHVRENEEAGIARSGYVSVNAIAQHGGMRAQVIADIEKRMASLASELRMWRLTAKERSALFLRLEEALAPVEDEVSA